MSIFVVYLYIFVSHNAMTGYMFASVKNPICSRNAPWLQCRGLSGWNPSEQHPPAILWLPPGLGALVLQACPVGNNNAHVRDSPRSISLLLKTSHSSPLNITENCECPGFVQQSLSLQGDQQWQTLPNTPWLALSPALWGPEVLHSSGLVHAFSVRAAPIPDQHKQNQHLHI